MLRELRHSRKTSDIIKRNFLQSPITSFFQYETRRFKASLRMFIVQLKHFVKCSFNNLYEIKPKKNLLLQL